MDRIIGILALAVSVVSAAIALVAARRTIKQGAENSASMAAVAVIEQARRREQLTPQFEIFGEQTVHAIVEAGMNLRVDHP